MCSKITLLAVMSVFSSSAFTQPTPSMDASPSATQAETGAMAETGTSSAPSWVDVTSFVGLLRPLGELNAKLKPGAFIGLGVGRALYSSPWGEARTLFSVTNVAKLPVKSSNQSGQLKMQTLAARFDYVFGTRTVRPWMGLGVGYYRWSLDVLDTGSQISNHAEGKDKGMIIAGGAEWRVLHRLFVVPEIGYQSISGSFDAALFSAALGARWQF